MASTSSTREERQRRHRRFTAREVIEMLQTAGSDVEEEEEDSESDFVAEESETGESDSSFEAGADEEEQGGGAASSRSSTASSDEDVRVGERQVSGEEIVEFLRKEWHQDFFMFPCVPEYSGQNTEGLHLQHMTSHAPLDFFDQIFDAEFLGHIVRETNRYARENLATRGVLPPRSIFHQWKDVTERDIIGFFAILVHMGLLHKPEVADYWSSNPILQSSFAPAIMSRDKFQLILAMLHVSNNADFIPRGRPGHNPLQKIQPVYSHLRRKFRQLYVPGENICLDEAMCPWRGKVGFRVYMKDKPVRWGMKLYELCESSSAYVYDFEIFAADPEISNKPVDVVMRLAEPLLNEGRSMYVDNYYCCPELADKLVDKDTHCVGTVRANRVGLPKQGLQAPVERGTVQAFRQGGVSVLKWMDKKPVHLITTKMDPREMKEVVSRSGRKNKPVAVQDYIQNMAGVDKSDQLMAYMPLNRKTMKWWKKLFFHLFTLSLIQAYILHKKFHSTEGQRKFSLKKFVVAVGNALAQRYHSTPAAAPVPGPAPVPVAGPSSTPVPGPAAGPSSAPVAGPSTAPVAGPSTAPVAGPSAAPAVQPRRAPPMPTPETRLAGAHYPSRIGVYQTGRTKFRDCFVCTARAARQPGVAKRRQTPNWCEKCGKALCVDKKAWGKDISCFQVYHTIKNYTDY